MQDQDCRKDDFFKNRRGMPLGEIEEMTFVKLGLPLLVVVGVQPNSQTWIGPTCIQPLPDTAFGSCRRLRVPISILRAVQALLTDGRCHL